MFSLCTSQVYYAKFPPQIEKRKVLLLLPVLGKWLQILCCVVMLCRLLCVAEEEPGDDAHR